MDFIRNYRNQIAHNLKFVTYKNKKFRLPTYITKKIINNKEITSSRKDFDDVYACVLALYILLNSPFLKTKYLYDMSRLLTDIPFNSPLSRIQEKISHDYSQITGLPSNFNVILALLKP